MSSWDPRASDGPRVPGIWLLLTALSLLPWSAAVNLWFARQGLYRPLLEASGGWIQPALQVCLPSILLYLLFFRGGGLRPRDLGLEVGTFTRGALATLLLWGLCHLVALAFLEGELQFAEPVTDAPAQVGGALLAQLLGNAFWEELVYRGFFLVQGIRWLRARGKSEGASLCFGGMLSAVVFAVPHIPNRIYRQAYEGPLSVLMDQGQLLFTGIFLAWICLRTRNLWWLIGLHSLANAPTLFVVWEGEFEFKLVVATVAAGITLAWPRWAGWVDRGADESTGMS